MRYEQDDESIIDTKIPVEMKKKFEDEYIIIEDISISKKVKIYKVRSKKDRLTIRTMHHIQKSSFCNLNDDKIMAKEFELLSSLDHPNIVKLITFYTYNMNFNIISEYFKEGSLDMKIKKHKIFSETQAKYVCKQLLNGIKYLNDHNLAHTDINPDIIYIKDIVKKNYEELYNVKILQFGSSSINIHKTNNSLYYMAPELTIGKYHQTSDIWSIGVIIYQMIFDDFPFKGYKEEEIVYNIQKSKPDLINKDASPYVKNLIKKMLIKDPFKRITVDECLKHDWFSPVADKYKKSNNNLTEMIKFKKFGDSNVSGYSGEFHKVTKYEETNTDMKKNYSKKISKKTEKLKKIEKEKAINDKKILDNSENSRSIESRTSSSIIESDSDESKTDSSYSYSDSKSSSSSSVSYSSFSPARCRSNSICMKPKIFSEFEHKKKNKKKQNKRKSKSKYYEKYDKIKTNKSIKSKLKSKFISKKSQPDIDLNEIKDNKNNENEKKINTNEDNINKKKVVQLKNLNETEKKTEENNSPGKGLIRFSKVNKKELIKNISLKHKNLNNGTNTTFFKKSYSLSILDASSDKSNGQKLSPLLIDSIKYMKYNIQIKYYKNKEMEKISKLFDNIVENKKKINLSKNEDNKGNNGNIINGNDNGSNIKIYATYNDLYIGYLNYIGQKRFFLDSYSDNKKMFADLSNYINENKKNGNIINTKYDKEDFIRILITFKEKFLENRLKISYQKLKKSNVTEIYSCLNEIEQKSELNYFKKYFNEMKNLMMKNKFKEIYLFYEYKNLIINSVINIFNKEFKEKKEKEKQKKEKQKFSKEKDRQSKEKDKHSKEKDRHSKEKEKHSKEKDRINRDKDRFSKGKEKKYKEDEKEVNIKGKSISPEYFKDKGIKGIIRVVTKKENEKNRNNVYHINSYERNIKSKNNTINNETKLNKDSDN